jgi:xanthine dehydrogenase accessory factor
MVCCGRANTEVLVNTMPTKPLRLPDLKILFRGAGEMATGCACRLYHSGFFRIVMTEIERPLAVRRSVSLCEGVYESSWTVENVRAQRIDRVEAIQDLWNKRLIPLLVDPETSCREIVKPDVLIDAILAKRNLGTSLKDAPLVIALGPGFCAGKDAHYVVETNRGHDLARLISDGYASPNTGVPGSICGHSVLRVLRSPGKGVFRSELSLGTPVEEGDVVGYVSGEPVKAQLKGILRGLIRSGALVKPGLKIGDIDPRGNASYCSTISEKAGAIAGAVLEAIMRTYNK